jgi:hypothetical protein
MWGSRSDCPIERSLSGKWARFSARPPLRNRRTGPLGRSSFDLLKHGLPKAMQGENPATGTRCNVRMAIREKSYDVRRRHLLEFVRVET